MKRHKHIRPITLLLAVLLIASGSAFAKNSRTLTLSSNASLAGLKVSAGEYKVSWESHSPTATVTLAKGTEVVATTLGKWVDRDIKYESNAVVYETNSDGSRTIVEIRFAGSKQALVFGRVIFVDGSPQVN